MNPRYQQRQKGRGVRARSGGGVPPWLVFAVGVAIVFGFFYVMQGAQSFIRTGGVGREEATRRALATDNAPTSTAGRATLPGLSGNAAAPLLSPTPMPTCTDFRVIVPNAIVRDAPTPNAAVVTGFNQGSIVCVLFQEPGTEWYAIDRNTQTRRHELAYMHQSVIEAVSPTMTPSMTMTPLPTVTPLPSEPPTRTPRATARPPDDARPTIPAAPSETPLPTATIAPFQSA